MSVEVRTCPPERFTELLKTAEIAFSEDVADDVIERVRAMSDPERYVCALEHDRFVATGGVFSQTLSVPGGGELAAGGVTFVTVVPSHRRRGLLRQMIRLMVDDCHERGEPLAMLWASEASIYQRFGYGLATWSVNLDADASAAAYTRPWPVRGTFRLIPAGDGRDLVAPVYEAVRRQRAGFLARPPEWWVGALPLADKDAKGGEAKRLVVYETDAGVEAYAVYKTKVEWASGESNGTVLVDEAFGSTADGTRAIWRYLFDIDLMRRLRTWHLPPDHPVLTLAAQPRRLHVSMGDGLWLRILDVKSALEGRTYGLAGDSSGRVTLELADEYCPWNAGRWTLDVEAGRARVIRATSEPDAALDANDLGSMLLGGFGASALAAGGRVTELRGGGLAAMDRLFVTALAPWCPSEF
jgi:predicted acetyltransferase